MSKFIFALAMVVISAGASAESVFCRKLNIGCYTQQEKAKAFERCQTRANESYQNALLEAYGNPMVWQLNGNQSAEDYAAMRKRITMASCIKVTPELSD